MIGIEVTLFGTIMNTMCGVFLGIIDEICSDIVVHRLIF